MFVVLVEFMIHAGEEERFLSAVRRQAKDSLNNEAACRRFDICLDSHNGAVVVLYEIYDTKKDFQVHLESDHFVQFDASTKDLVAQKTVRELVLQEDATT